MTPELEVKNLAMIAPNPCVPYSSMVIAPTLYLEKIALATIHHGVIDSSTTVKVASEAATKPTTSVDSSTHSFVRMLFLQVLVLTNRVNQGYNNH